MLPPPSGGGAIKGHINPGTLTKPDDVPFDGPVSCHLVVNDESRLHKSISNIKEEEKQ